MNVIGPTVEDSGDAEMQLSKDEPVLLFVGIYLLILGFVGIALFNVTRPNSTPMVGLIASVIWILLVGTVVVGSCIDEGPVQFLVNALGMLAARQFVQIQGNPGEAALVCFGYRLCGFRLYYLKVHVRRIALVEWDTGQATALAGRDMDDWRVYLRYETTPLVSCATPDDRRKSLGIHCVDRSGPRPSVEEFGRKFVDFLRRAGAELAPSADGRGFVRPN